MDVIGSLRKILVASQAVGLAPYKFQDFRKGFKVVESRKLLHWTSIFFTVNIVILAWTLIEEALEEMKNLREMIWTSARIINLLVFLICSFQVYLTAIFKSSELCFGLNLINDFFRLLPGNVNKLRRFVKKYLIFNIFSYLTCLLHGLLVNIIFLKANVNRLIQVAFFFGFLLVMNVYAFQFVVLTYLARYAHQKVNGILWNQSEKMSRRVSGSSLKKIRNQDSKVRDFVGVIESVFFRFVFLYIFWIFTIMVHGCMWVIQADSSVINLFIWSLYYLGQTFSILYVCKSTVFQAEKTANYLHELFIDNDDPDLKEEIEIFSLQLLHRKVEFNACGFFKLDFSLLYSMVGAVTTYIIILMQFQGNHTTGYGTCPTNCTNCSVA